MPLPVISWIIHILKSLIGFFNKIVCRRRKASVNQQEDDGSINITIGLNHQSVDRSTNLMPNQPLTNGNQIMSHNILQEETRGQFVDWNTWQDNSNINSFDEQNEAEGFDNGLNVFKDMEPQLTKPKTLRVSKLATGPARNDHFQNRLHMESINLQLQTELGTWEEDPGGWDDNVLEDSEVSEETRNLLLDKRKTDKQRRAMEQIKKREELRLNRAEKKPHLGMKLN